MVLLTRLRSFLRGGTQAEDDVSTIFAATRGHINYASVRDNVAAVQSELDSFEAVGAHMNFRLGMK